MTTERGLKEMRKSKKVEAIKSVLVIRGSVQRTVIFGRDEIGEYHEGRPIMEVQKDGKLTILCPFGHLIAYDVYPEFMEYYRKPIRCYGKV